MRLSHVLLFLAVLLTALVPGCSAKGPNAPIINGWHEPISKQGVYIVQPGDSLYSIAWRYGLDYQDLAKINHIRAPYKLERGQKLYLVAPGKTPVKASPHSAKPKSSSKAKPAQSTVKISPKAVAPATVAKGSVLVWQWPAAGRVLHSFNAANLQTKGIDIVNTAGTPIKAAASGQVVYSGSGLPGYGYLIIIKHNATYLSAYAHNSSVSVKEGQEVKKGQVIALMGNTGADRVMLHFEIRRYGQPIDPQSLLPKR